MADSMSSEAKQTDCGSGQVLQVVRPHYEQEQLNNELHYCKPQANTYKDYLKKSLNCNLAYCFSGIFPITSWLAEYSVKRDLLADVITGCTVAIMHIPQGMGYALLGGVPPIIGIYMAFFPVLIYTVLGTSRHNSMGTFAVVSIMVGKIVQKHTNHDMLSLIVASNGTSHVELVPGAQLANFTPTEIGATVCFVVGLMQLTMYAFRLGVISSLLSETLVSGFTTGAAVHVLTSQMKDLLGVTITKSPGYFELINNYIKIFSKIAQVNWIAISLSILTIAVLVINNDVLKPKLVKLCTFPVPIELLVVLTGTLMSRFLNLKENYNLNTIGEIPTGFPDFQPPKTGLISDVLVDCVPIAMVSYTVTVSMAIIFAQRHSYEVDFNQELLAMGAGNVFASFFSCMPFAASLSRSTIQETVGGKTQIASLVSCGILAIVLLWVGPFFGPLPICVLAGIIVVSLKGMLMQVKQFFDFWRLSRLDAVVWIVTFLTVVIVAIDIGLLVGIILSLACIFIRGMKPYTCLLGNVPRTDLYLDVNRYKAAEELPNLKIFHYCGSINFASRNSFKTEICSLLGIDLGKEIKEIVKADEKALKYEPIGFKVLIIDFSALSYIDPSGVTALNLLIKDFQKLGVIVYMAGCSCPVYEIMKKCGLKESSDVRFKLFPTIHDAVHHAIDVIMPISIIQNDNCKESV